MKTSISSLSLCAASVFVVAILFSPWAAAGEPAPPGPSKAEKGAAGQPKEEKAGEPGAGEGTEEGPAKGEAVKESGKELEPITVTTPTRGKSKKLDIPYSITALTREDIEELGVRVAIDALAEEMGLWVQHRTGTTGDPVMRGLSGGELLTLINGNTLTTFWGEGAHAGDDMYQKLDPSLVDRIEIVRGPASVLYGSNALGGVINLITRTSPFPFPKEGFRGGARAYLGYQSVNNYLYSRGEAYGACPGFRFLVGGSGMAMDNLRGGGNVGEQANTSGQTYNWDAQAEIQLAKGHVFGLSALHHSGRNTKRYFRPNVNNDNERDGYAITYTGEQIGFLKDTKLSLYHQNKTEYRYYSRNASEILLGLNGFAETDTYTADLQTSILDEDVEDLGKQRLIVGGGWHVDYGESPDDEAFTLWQSDWPVTTDFRYGPGGHRKNAPDSTWDNVSAFAQFEGGLEWLRVNLGIRYDHFHFASDPYSSWYYPAGYVRTAETLREAQARDEVDLVRDAVTGGAGLLLKMGEHASAFANVTKGYRMWPPKFGITQIGVGVLVPSSRLEPIVSYNTEIGLKIEHPKLSAEAVGYYSHFKGWPDYTAATFNGQDWFDFDRDATRDGNETCYMEIASYGAICYGFESVLTYRFQEDLLPIVASKDKAWTGFSVKAGFSWNWGMILGTHDPFRHTQPAHGILYVRWDDPVAKRGWVEFGLETARRYSRIPATMESTYEYAVDPAVGGSPRIRGTTSSPYLPGWTVFNLRAGYEISTNARVNLGLENIGNKEYRRAHSRLKAEGGFNVNVGLVIDFQ